MPCAGARLGSSPIAAVSSDYAGLDAFFAERGVEYLHCGKYKDQQAKNDAERAARQFDVVRRKYGRCEKPPLERKSLQCAGQPLPRS